jgi:hypothetical protein
VARIKRSKISSLFGSVTRSNATIIYIKITPDSLAIISMHAAAAAARTEYDVLAREHFTIHVFFQRFQMRKHMQQ